MPPSEERETEWNEEIEEAGAWREGELTPSLDSGGYVWSTVSESDLEGVGIGWLGLRVREEVDEFDGETDLSEE